MLAFRLRQRLRQRESDKIERTRMKAKPFITCALALVLPASTLLAQNQTEGTPDQNPPPSQNDGPPGGGRGRHHHPPALIMALDANHDGVISADEIANAPAALKTLDKNGDGQLTFDEYMGPPPGKHGNGGTNAPAGPPQDEQNGSRHPKHPVPPMVAALDTNGDGIISADEIANASASLLTLDKNGDGQLTRDELMPPRPPHDGPPDAEGPDGQSHRPPPPNENN